MGHRVDGVEHAMKPETMDWFLSYLFVGLALSWFFLMAQRSELERWFELCAIIIWPVALALYIVKIIRWFREHGHKGMR